MYAVLRADLHMTAGKACSQAGHAFVEAFERAHPDTRQAYGHGTKVVLQCAGLRDLRGLLDAAAEAGIPAALVIESGHVMPPAFDGSSIPTAVGLGPAPRSTLRALTRRFRLLG